MTDASRIDEVLIMSWEGWTADWMSRQSLSAALARYVDVTYVGQPRYPQGIPDLVTIPKSRKADGLTVSELPCWMNTHFEDAHRHRWLSRQVKRKLLFRRSRGRSRAMLVYHPSLVSYLDAVSADVTAYHVVDFFGGFRQSEEERALLMEQEASLLERVDVVFVTWRGLAERLGVEERAVLLPHGVEFEYYSKAARREFATPADFPVGRPTMGYAGSLNESSDIDLMHRLVQELHEWDLVLIGHNTIRDPHLAARFSALCRLPNVFHLGVKSRTELGGYLQMFDVCLMCYKITAWTELGLPVKMLQYFAAGKPIVSTYLPSLEDYGEYIAISRTHDEFIASVAGHATLDTPERREARMAFAARNTWDHRARKVLDVLTAAKAGKQSRL